MRPKIYTSRFSNRELASLDAIKVQISMGSPKWTLPYSTEKIYILAPSGIAWDEDFDANYISTLEMYGVEKIESQFQKIWRMHPGKDLILLCYENIYEKACHRRVFAEWWKSQTGEIIEELEKPPLPKKQTNFVQMSLL